MKYKWYGETMQFRIISCCEISNFACTLSWRASLSTEKTLSLLFWSCDITKIIYRYAQISVTVTDEVFGKECILSVFFEVEVVKFIILLIFHEVKFFIILVLCLISNIKWDFLQWKSLPAWALKQVLLSYGCLIMFIGAKHEAFLTRQKFKGDFLWNSKTRCNTSCLQNFLFISAEICAYSKRSLVAATRSTN